MTDDNVIAFSGTTLLDLPPERVLSAAIDEGLEAVVVLGWGADGAPYFAASVSDGGEMLWLMALLKRVLLDAGSSRGHHRGV